MLDTFVQSTPLRVPGSNIRNTATADLAIQLTKLFDVHVGYANTVYAYQQNAGDESPGQLVSELFGAVGSHRSNCGRLICVGKRCRKPLVCSVSNMRSWITPVLNILFIRLPALRPASAATAATRKKYFVYVGADQSFTPNLNGSIRPAANTSIIYNADQHEISPYIDASLTYQYMPQSTAQVGVKHLHNPPMLRALLAGHARIG